MKLFDFLNIMYPDIKPEQSKIHFATSNGIENPLDVYIAGKFDDWQKWQTKKNFKRKYVISLIQLQEPQKWLFTGVYRSHGAEFKKPNGAKVKKTNNDWYYDLRPLEETSELAGRLVLSCDKRKVRLSYLNAENWVDKATLAWIRPERLTIEDFPGYASVLIRKSELDLIIRENTPSWRSALENVAGVYLIADRKTGKFYVGSATGEDGIWSRWCDYSKTCHGGNKDLKTLLNHEGKEYAENFQFSVLEIADPKADAEDVIARESRWKELLLTREFGYNMN